MATNEEWAVPAILSERRFFALHVSNKRTGDTAYFEALKAELALGGLEAFLYDLLQMSVTAAEVPPVPKTEELRVQQNMTLPLELRWWQECLWDETKIGDGWGECSNTSSNGALASMISHPASIAQTS